ncbi:MAG: TonB-dependent receptor [Henriciella sp.]|uniref:TonB-dependent receptor n=1 Tax=Henriciella sp. TaxID=1968823 RepID=UPI003C76F53A
MYRKFKLFTGTAAIALSATLCAVPASAQEAGDTATETGTDDASNETAQGSSLKLQPVVVNSRKRVERLRDVPISAEVQTGEQLADLAIPNLERMSLYVPNLTIQPAPGVPSLYIRGIGSGPNNPAFEPSVGLFVDGIYLGRGRQTSSDFLDVERVEVLRGPQGALLGKNTSSGAINITTANPGQDTEFSLTATGFFEGDEGYEATAVASGPLSDNLGARIALRLDDRDGWLYNTAKNQTGPQRESLQGRLTLVYDLNPAARFTFKATHFDYDYEDDFFSTSAFGDPKTFTRATSPEVDEFDDGDSTVLALTGEFDLGGGYTLTSTTGYSEFSYLRQVDSDFAEANLFKTQFGESFWQLSQELRLASPTDGPFSWLAGAYIHRAESDDILAQSTITFLPTFDGVGTRSMDQETDSLSAYGQASYRFTDRWQLTGGVRVTNESKSATYDRFNVGSVPGTWSETDLEGEIEETELDPSVQLQYFLDNGMLYVSLARGSKGGGFVAASTAVEQDGFAYDGEVSKSVEVGGKFDLADGRAQLNVAVFQTKYEDLQVSAWDPAANATITRNAADATSQGIEVGLTARISEPLTFRGSAAYLDAKYDDFPNALCLYDPNPAPGVCLENIGGTDIPRAPEWSASGGLYLDTPITSSLQLTGNVTASYRSGIFLDDNLNPASYQDEFTKIDARIGIGSINDNWELAVIGLNLTDELTSSYALGTPFTAGSESYSIDPPRVIGVQMTLRN